MWELVIEWNNKQVDIFEYDTEEAAKAAKARHDKQWDYMSKSYVRPYTLG